jgi:putative transposase
MRSCAGPRLICGRPICRERLYPLVSELAVDGIPVAVTCRVLKLARQPYYRWRANPITGAEIIEAYRANALFDAHRDDPEFGYRYTWSRRPATPVSRWQSAPPGGSARRTDGGASSARRAARTAKWALPFTMILSSETSPPVGQISCGSAISPSVALARASSTYKLRGIRRRVGRRGPPLRPVASRIGLVGRRWVGDG